ncbi:MAG: hypothetical protein K9W44_08320 [Candidatus Lokiarchaeota archaeon]|nr:hypothetical protein [Candidatus Harpocratesius repetitus]
MSFVKNSLFERGYFRHAIKRIGYMVHLALLFSSYLRKGHTFGSLQHAPQRLHEPLRFLLTGKKILMVLRYNFAQ